MEGQVIENAVQETVKETVDKVNSNWDQIKAYFNGHIPDLISFGMKVVLSIVAFYVGTKLIKWLLKVAKSSMEKAGIDMGVAQFICSFGKFLLYLILIFNIATNFGVKESSENMSKTAIEVDNVSMKFNLSREKVDSLKDYIFKTIKREIQYNEFWALKNVSFSVEKGDRVGILGLNGAGKSTLLKVISGVFKPTEGHVDKHGKMVPLLELGAGFDPQYTGKENIYLYGAMLGYTKKFIDSKYDEIVEFSELQKFMDVPVKNYSSGMKSRLGFSIATVVEPKILILDEVLSVGDAKFRKKSEKKIMSMFDSGVTVLFVSHSLEQVQRLCNKAMILEKGKLIAYGDIDPISEQYSKMIGG